ncbi:MAG: SURF1 family protein [Gammaproteobacteria bacterium]|nr:SURF1 family protein [Gammaproteobacteria bacterium]
MTLLGLLLFSSLGVWQLDRAEQKEALMARYEMMALEAPLAVNPALAEAGDIQYRPIVAEGVFRGGHTAFLDNQVYQGRVGYHVLSPLELTPELWLWVDRGWVPADLDREVLPEVTTPVRLQRVIGTAYLPSRPGLTLGESGEGQSWPQRIQRLDLTWLESLSGTPAMPFVLRLGADQPDGFVRAWSTIAMSADKHLAYAVQWFLFALIAIVIYVHASCKREPQADV